MDAVMALQDAAGWDGHHGRGQKWWSAENSHMQQDATCSAES